MSNSEDNNLSKVGDLVVVGSSAGGVEALTVLVSSLRKDFPAPIVLAQHLDPTRPSNLGAILQQKTVLEVVVITGRTRLEAGKIYVVPSNQHVQIEDSHIEAIDEKDGRPRPSVNLLLKTAAATYGERLIAVVLTGAGSDGADGAMAVKNAGGMVIVQNPSTARFPSMPSAVSPVALDFQLDLEQIGPFLYDLLTKVELPVPTDKPDNVLQRIFELVNRQANIDFRQYKSSTILRRIGRRMAATRKRTMSEYADYIEQFTDEISELVKAFLINVTQFFRDPSAYNYLKANILPILIEQARDRDRTLRFWSAGCATGEEPYSLAMLLADLLGSELAEWSIKIFATDLDEAAIDFARRGLFSESMVKDVPAVYRERYFEFVEQEYRISKTLRQMVIFGHQDLSRNAPFPRIDMVLCRNLLIYFTPELQDYVINHFAFSLRATQGFLLLGKAETIRPTHTYYEMVNKQWKIYRCTNKNVPILRRQNDEGENSVLIQNQRVFARPMAILPSVRNLTIQEADNNLLSNELSQLRRFNETLLRFLPVGVVVIDRSYRLLTANGAARRLLGLHEIGVEQDFLHAVRGIPYTEVRAAIDTVFRERRSLSLPEIELNQTVGGNGRFVSLSIVIMQLESDLPDLAVISITDVTEQVQIRQGLETAQLQQSQTLQELSTANRRLNDLNKELLDANEEMQVANEELVLTHEELQATIEEFETTNEELQATNEELETNNEELQATNEELQTTNDELRARTSEIQEISNMLTNEQAHLSEVIAQAPFYIMFLRGPSLLVEAFNPRYAQLVENRRVQNRPLEEVYSLFFPQADSSVLELAYQAFQEDKSVTTLAPVNSLDEQSQASSIRLSYTLQPSHDTEGRVDGVIVYAVEAND